MIQLFFCTAYRLKKKKYGNNRNFGLINKPENNTISKKERIESF